MTTTNRATLEIGPATERAKRYAAQAGCPRQYLELELPEERFTETFRASRFMVLETPDDGHDPMALQWRLRLLLLRDGPASCRITSCSEMVPSNLGKQGEVFQVYGDEEGPSCLIVDPFFTKEMADWDPLPPERQDAYLRASLWMMRHARLRFVLICEEGLERCLHVWPKRLLNHLQHTKTTLHYERIFA